MITEIWTEATTGADGRYRLYVQADVYDIQVRVPGVGVARLPEHGRSAPTRRKPLDIRLEPGRDLPWPKVVDAGTGEPVAGRPALALAAPGHRGHVRRGRRRGDPPT